MTITLTIEELKAYQDKVTEHIKNTLRLRVVHGVLFGNPASHSPMAPRESPVIKHLREEEARIQKCLEDNPVPRLIPEV